MKTLAKLALVSALAMSSSAFAMQALDDESMSATTGQDGVTIKLSGAIAFDYLAIHDGNGITGSGLTPAQSGITTATSGAIVIGGWNGTTSTPVTVTAANGINILIDADGNSNAAGNNAVLNINLDLGNTTVAVGSIGVAASTAGGKTLTERKNVLDIGTVTLNGLKVNVQLGNQPQGAMIKLNSAVTGGLTLSSLALKGQNGQIGLGSTNITSTGSADLNLALNIDPIAGQGLVITGLGNLDIAASALNLGGDVGATPTTNFPDNNVTLVAGATTANLGAMYISKLSVGNITISGH
jgi:hypothetical protein